MSSALKLFLALAGVVLFIFVGSAIFFYSNPVGVSLWLTRRALTGAGLESVAVPAPRGDQRVWRGGSGSTVVLLHGLGDQAGAWARIAPELARKHRLLIPDLAGHGDSEPTDGALGLRDLVEGLEAVLDEPGEPARVTLVGHDLGGWVAVLYALEHPERVERLVLVASLGLARVNDTVTRLPSDAEQAGRLVKALGTSKGRPLAEFVLDDMVQKLRRGPIRRLYGGVEPTDYLEDRLPRVAVPVTVIWGEADALTPLEQGEYFDRRLPDSELRILPGCGHVPQQSCPGDLLRSLRRALPLAPEDAPGT